jgi:hypothetical protein
VINTVELKKQSFCFAFSPNGPQTIENISNDSKKRRTKNNDTDTNSNIESSKESISSTVPFTIILQKKMHLVTSPDPLSIDFEACRAVILDTTLLNADITSTRL